MSALASRPLFRARSGIVPDPQLPRCVVEADQWPRPSNASVWESTARPAPPARPTATGPPVRAVGRPAASHHTPGATFASYRTVSSDGCRSIRVPDTDDNRSWLGKLKATHGETGPNPTDRGKSGQKQSVLTEGHGLPIGVVLAGANRHDSPLLRPTLECLSRFGFFLPETIQIDLDSGYDSRVTRELLAELGCESKTSPKGTYIEINHTRRWKVERTNSWHTRGFGLLQVVLDRVDRVQQAWVCLANTIIILKRLLQEPWTQHRWATRPVKRYDWR